MSEAIVTLPDGRKVRLSGPDRDAIMRQAMALKQQGAPQAGPGPAQGNLQPVIPQQGLPPQAGLNRSRLVEGLPGTEINTESKGGGGDAFFRAGVEQFANNATQLPSLLLNLAANSSLNPARLLPPDSEIRDQLTPALTDRTIPLPTGQQVVAGMQAGAQVPGALLRGENANLSQRFDQSLVAGEQLAQEHPTAAMLGRGAGDAATLITGRAPIVSARAPALAAKRATLEKVAREKLKLPDEIEEQVTDVVSRRIVPFLQSTGRQTARAGSKAAGVGLEGATLALLDQQDPEQMFWFGAAGQTVGSASLFLVEKPIKRLLPFVATAWVASEMFKAVAPGDQNFFESKDFAIHKAVAAFGLGTAAALSGAGRLRGPTAERFPKMLDAITAAPRGAILGRINELRTAAEAGNDLPLRAMERYATNQQSFNSNVQNALGRALNSNKEGAFTKEVQRLMRESKAFREAMTEAE